ncbi:PAS domain S-box protein [Ectothiorhodospira haloalkaliphila]|uniref:PAS domain S-box protein n=1 Tax=Ectothiorhodospira haloalkaliphila TaxID=421628 RepID=UPI001EE82F4B|nr:PAS domain S-box protein [Ectothiorhodospira haloalkaliphila]MCG5526123.1 PAS domain S-box protein [Ectothiorhodospira haloalkaliphila]
MMEKNMPLHGSDFETLLPLSRLKKVLSGLAEAADVCLVLVRQVDARILASSDCEFTDAIWPWGLPREGQDGSAVTQGKEYDKHVCWRMALGLDDDPLWLIARLPRQGVASAVDNGAADRALALLRSVEITLRMLVDSAWENRRLGEHEQRYRTMVESQHDAIVRVDAENRLLFVNDTYCRTFGKTREELLGRSFAPLVHEDDIADTLKAMEGLSQPPHRVQIEQRALTVDGWRWFHWEDTAIVDAQGKIVEVLGVGRDITELKEKQATLESIFRASEDVAFIITRTDAGSGEALVAEFSPGAENLFGYSRQEILGRPVAMLHQPEDVARFPEMLVGIREGRPWRGRMRLIRKGGDSFPSLLTIYPFDSQDSGSTLGVSIDISLLEQAEQALRQARDEAEAANQAKSLFMAMTSHEVRTPLTAMLGLIENLLETSMEARQHRYVTALRSSCEMLRGIINDILDFSESEAGQQITLNPEAVSLPGLLRQSLELMEAVVRTRGNQLVIDMDPSLPDGVWVDALRLRQVLSNVLGNANQYTRNGRITVRAWAEDAGGDANALHRVIIQVSDTGMGMSPEVLQRVFEPFYKSHHGPKGPGGTGLGLAIVHNLLQALGGRICVKSEEGEGTTFTIGLDLSPAPVPDPVPPLSENPDNTLPSARSRRASILVVDDNPEILEMVGETLESFGHQVTSASNGESAVRLAMEQRFELILMDCQMPVMTGLEAARRIREQEPAEWRTPIIALTAAVMKEDVRAYDLAGMDDHLSKPYTRKELRNLLTRWLQS